MKFLASPSRASYFLSALVAGGLVLLASVAFIHGLFTDCHRSTIDKTLNTT